MTVEHKFIKIYSDDFCVLNIEEIGKAWDHRFTIFENLYDNQYEFIKYLRRGSGCYDMKLQITPEHAKEIISQLGLVVTGSIGWEKKYNFYRKPGVDQMDMRRKKKVVK